MTDEIKEATVLTQETETLSVERSFLITETEWAELKALLDKRYTEITTLLRYNKTKDESIQRLSAEIQKYREGFAFSALKPFITALITLREDCKKSIRDAEKHGLDEAKAKKFIDFLVSGIEEMISNLGLEREGDSITINGKPLFGLSEPRKLPEKIIPEENKDDFSVLDNVKITNLPELFEYLNKNEKAIRLALNERSVVDKTIAEYITLSARTDAEHYFALVAPIAHAIYGLYDIIYKNSKTISGLSSDDIIKLYDKMLCSIVKRTDEILTSAGIIIEPFEGVFNGQIHKLLRTIPTNDEKLDRTIANTYTDCYAFDEKVIYQSKVDVYKFQQ